MSQLISMSAEEVMRRSSSLTKAIKAWVAEQRELTDIALDSLLNAYVLMANESGRLKEAPRILRSWADHIDALSAKRTTH